jgi:hypothetical protein
MISLLVLMMAMQAPTATSRAVDCPPDMKDGHWTCFQVDMTEAEKTGITIAGPDRSIPIYVTEVVTRRAPHCLDGWHLQRWHWRQYVGFNSDDKSTRDDGYYDVVPEVEVIDLRHPDRCVKDIGGNGNITILGRINSLPAWLVPVTPDKAAPPAPMPDLDALPAFLQNDHHPDFVDEWYFSGMRYRHRRKRFCWVSHHNHIHCDR